MRADVAEWAEGVKTHGKMRQCEHMEIDWGGPAWLCALVFEDAGALLVCIYLDPPVDGGLSEVPSAVYDAAERALRKYQSDQRSWTVMYWDAKFGFMEAKNGDGDWSKVYFGEEKAIKRVYQTADDVVGEIKQTTPGGVQSMFDAWMRRA